VKASEMIKVLQQALLKHGDVEVLLHGHYGCEGIEFRESGEEDGQYFRRWEKVSNLPGRIHIMTDLGD